MGNSHLQTSSASVDFLRRSVVLHSTIPVGPFTNFSKLGPLLSLSAGRMVSQYLSVEP